MWYMVHNDTDKVFKTMVEPSVDRLPVEIGIERIVSTMPELSGKLEARLLADSCPICELSETDYRFEPFCSKRCQERHEQEMRAEAMQASEED